LLMAGCRGLGLKGVMDFSACVPSESPERRKHLAFDV
jgi:hypothetical protein